jgi:hypothetical protein
MGDCRDGTDKREPDRYQPKLLVLLCAHVGRLTEVRLSSKADVRLPAVIDHHGPTRDIGEHTLAFPCAMRSLSAALTGNCSKKARPSTMD